MTNQTTKKEKVTENDEKKGVSSIFRRDTVGRTDYIFAGSIDIENLCFWAMHPEIGMSVVSTATAVALRSLPLNLTEEETAVALSSLPQDLIEATTKEIGSLNDFVEMKKLGQLGIFKTPTMHGNGVYGFRLNEETAKNAILGMIDRLASLRIRRGGGALGTIKELKMQMVYITTTDGFLKTRKTAFRTAEEVEKELRKPYLRLYRHWIPTGEMLLRDEVAATAKKASATLAASVLVTSTEDELPTDGLAYINFSGTLEGQGCLNYVMARESTYLNSDGEEKPTDVAAARTTHEGFAKISSNCLRYEIFKADEPVNVRGRSDERPSFVKRFSNLSGLFRGLANMDKKGSALKHTGLTITDAVSREKPTEEFFASTGPRKN